MIPKKIHYIWLGGNKKPKNFGIIFEGWHKYAPGFEIIEWNESNIGGFELPKYYTDCINSRKYAFASDALRFLILERYGGIYLDIDQVLIKNIDTSLLLEREAIISKYHEVDDYYGFGFVGTIPNGLFVAQMNKYYKEYNPSKYFIVNKAGSEIINKLIVTNPENITIFEQDYFYPLADSDRTENTYSYHLSNTSWVPGYKKLLQRMPLYKTVKELAKKVLPSAIKKKIGFNVDYL